MHDGFLVDISTMEWGHSSAHQLAEPSLSEFLVEASRQTSVQQLWDTKLAADK